ncbi:hypothetical protein [Actinomadura rubrisoli]|uniref:hypothetical protein n=1 Tax=Actinomadura rubrisoli TaxID=2530368 RepID=UPI0014045D13|nr:hypothetical protein [Actinomadura rubrisoli]
MYLIYAPLIAVFAVFVIYGGLVMPAMEIVQSVRRRRPDEPPGADVVELRPEDDRRVAA